MLLACWLSVVSSASIPKGGESITAPDNSYTSAPVAAASDGTTAEPSGARAGYPNPNVRPYLPPPPPPPPMPYPGKIIFALALFSNFDNLTL